MTDRDWLADLIKLGERFRNTPIVDDDFDHHRDRFDQALVDANKHLRRERPVVVCLCGSTRFLEAFRATELKETLAGKIVLTIGCDTKSDDMLNLPPGTKEMLDTLHLRKLDLCDEAYILNVGGYIGESTRRELNYAVQNGKIVRFLELKESK